jgi:stearoyl-CoA desaturase (delta-9 desaturase)
MHGAYKISPTLNHIGRFVMYTIAIGIYPEWMRINVGTHRMHHRNSDTIDDSHTPHLLPFKALLNEKYNPYYKRVNKKELGNYALDIPILDDWMQQNVYTSQRRFYGCALVVAIYGMLFGWLGLLMAPILLMFTANFMMPMIATWIPHKLGFYRHKDHKFPDRSLNLIPIGIYLCGEELHSNHHANPRSYNLRNRWFEFDIGYYYAILFEKLGLIEFKDRTVD